MKRNVSIDILKTLSCFAVVVLHVTAIIVSHSKTYTISHTLYYISGFAVPMFFMANGYLLLNKEHINYKYIIKKISNIILLVFLWNVIIFLGKIILKKEIVNPFYMIFENFLQQGYFSQFWFFGALLIIYLFLPIIHKFFRNYKASIIITGIFILISLNIDLISLIRSINDNSIIQVHVIQTFRIWTWFSYFLLGGLIGKEKIKEFIIKNISITINIITFLLSIIVISIYQYNVGLLYKNHHAEFFYDNIFMFIYVISLFILIYRQNFNKYNSIDTISNNTMGIYIVHTTIIKSFTHFYKFDTSLSNMVFIFIVFIGSSLLTLIMSKIPIVKRLVKL